MKRLIILLLTVFALSVITPANAFNFFKSDSQKFDEQIALAIKAHEGGYPDKAKEELDRICSEMDKIIIKKLDDYDFQFVFAKCQFLLGYFKKNIPMQKKAENKFNLLALKDQRLRQAAFEFYRSQSEYYSRIKKLEQALRFTVTAYQKFSPSQARTQKAALELYTHFEKKIAYGDSNIQAGMFLWATLRLNGNLRIPAKKAIINASLKQTDPNLGLKILRLVYDLNRKPGNQKIGKIAAKIIGNKKPAKTNLLANYFPELKNFPNGARAVVIAILYPPDYITYHPGQKKVFALEAGQSSNHYVRFNKGKGILWQLKYGAYEVHTRNGKIYQMGKVPEYFSEDFKIVAITDVDMRLVFQ